MPHVNAFMSVRETIYILLAAQVRPVGIPGVFFPLDTCGRILHRRGMTLKVRFSSTLLVVHYRIYDKYIHICQMFVVIKALMDHYFIDRMRTRSSVIESS